MRTPLNSTPPQQRQPLRRCTAPSSKVRRQPVQLIMAIRIWLRPVRLDQVQVPPLQVITHIRTSPNNSSNRICIAFSNSNNSRVNIELMDIFQPPQPPQRRLALMDQPNKAGTMPNMP